MLVIVRAFRDRNCYLGLLGFSVLEFPHLCALSMSDALVIEP